MKVSMNCKKEVVAAALPMQQHWVPLSNLDLLLPPLQVGVFFCYKSSGGITAASSVLKVALAKTLVSYYAFGGEVVSNKSGEPELLCNNAGVDFFQASADVKLIHLDLHNPDASVQGKLVPALNRGVLAVQVTELKCGGVVVGCTFDHRIADAYSANMFLVSWAEAARHPNSTAGVSIIPSFRRSVLSPRRPPPPTTDPSLDDMYVTISKLPPPPPLKQEKENEHNNNNNDDDDDEMMTSTMISRIFYIQADQLKHLQTLASSSSGSCNSNTPSKLECFCSLLWKLISKFAAGGDDDGKKKKVMTRMGVVVDGRSRLGNMESYFGNVLSIPFGQKPADELAHKPLSWVAQQVHRFLDQAATKEHFLGLIDWVEARRPEPNAAKIYIKGREEEGWPAFVVSSGQRFPVTKVDFGWGKPVFGSYHFPWGGDSGYVMPMPSPLENGDWVVYMHLSKPQLDFIHSEASHVFRPLTPNYLRLLL